MDTSNSKHLEYQFSGPSSSGKTKTWVVYNHTTDVYIGIIKWAGNFRKYAFFAEPGMMFDASCLEDVAEFLRAEMIEHRLLK